MSEDSKNAAEAMQGARSIQRCTDRGTAEAGCCLECMAGLSMATRWDPLSKYVGGFGDSWSMQHVDYIQWYKLDNNPTPTP